MPYALNAFRPGDNYADDDGDLACPLTERVNVYVEYAPIYFQFAVEDPNIRGEVWTEEVLLFRGFYFFSRSAVKVRVRRALPGIIAIVTIEALKAHEIP